MKRKILEIYLVLCMVFIMFPVSVFAEENAPIVDTVEKEAFEWETNGAGGEISGNENGGLSDNQIFNQLENESTIEEADSENDMYAVSSSEMEDYPVNEENSNSTEISEVLEECEVIASEESSIELKAGQMAALPAHSDSGSDYTQAAITDNGSLYCWGPNRYGEVGNGSTENQSSPVEVLGNVTSVTISSYGYIKAAITGNGKLYCWGYNAHGEVGNGKTKDQSSPVKVLDNVASVAISDSGSYYGHVMSAITNSGKLYRWGYNCNGEVGNGSTKNQSRPVEVLDNVISIFDSGSNKAAITSNGELYCWGKNARGEAGNGKTGIQSTPVKVLDNVASYHGTAAITNNGELYCWGNNSLSDGSSETPAAPQKVMDNVASYHNTAVITSNGELYCWGQNECGEVGNGKFEEQSALAKVLDNVTSYFRAGYTRAALTGSGELYCWGYNIHGEAGNGNMENQSTPVKVLDNVISYSSSQYLHGLTNAAITSNGELYCWGRNDSGQVGNGTTEHQSSPAKVLDNVTSVFHCESTSIAVTSNGELYRWGTYSLGNERFETQSRPVKILDNVASLDSCYYDSIAAITNNGELYCWGSNTFGEVGNESVEYQSTPVKVLDNVTSCFESRFDERAEYGRTKAAITSNGDLYCWGYNGTGQVGNGSIINQTAPIKILNLVTDGSGGSEEPEPTLPEKAEQKLKNKYGSGGKRLEKQVGSKLTQKVTGAKTPVTFSSSNTKAAKVGKTSGVITCVGVGKAVITSKAAESDQYKAATSKMTIYVIPKTANIKSVKSNKKGQVTITGANGAKDNDGYQIQYKHNGKTRTVKASGKKSLTKTFKNLKSRKDFKVRIRAYKKVKGVTYYGTYSKWKTLKKVN